MKTAFLAVLGILSVCAAARAATPSAAHCTVDHVMISSWNETPTPNGGLGPCSPSTPGFDVVVRDATGTPIGNAQVKIVFGGTGTGVSPYQNLGPGPISAHCSDRSIVINATDGQGRVNLVPHFGRWAESPVVPVFADGIQIALVEARSPDYDCDGDVDLSDLTTFSGDYLDTHAYHARSDFDDCPGTSLGDLVFFAGQYLSSSAGSPRPVCN